MQFKFRLEKILHLIQMREMAKKGEILSIVRRLAFLEGRKSRLQENIHTLLEKGSGDFRLEWIPYKEMKIPSDAHEIQVIDKRITEERKSLETKKEELSRIVMRRKGLESLRDKRFRDFRVQKDRVYQKRMDELHRLLKIERN